jgi:hypothetical protein
MYQIAVVQAQLRTVPCYIVGAVWAILNCFMSWYLDSRGVAIITCMVFQTMGYAIAITTTNPHARYAACFLGIIGGSASGPLVIAAATSLLRPLITFRSVPHLGRR